MTNPGYMRFRYDGDKWSALDGIGYEDGAYVRRMKGADGSPAGEIALLSGGKRYPLTGAYFQRNKIWEKATVYDIFAVQYDAIPYGGTFT